LKFFEHESCGKCVPCREGTEWLRKILERVEGGKGKDGDIELLTDVAENISGKTFCPLGDAAAGVVAGMLSNFRNEFEEHIKTGNCKFKI